MSKLSYEEEKLIKFSYEGCLEQTARLQAYAASKPLLNADIVNEKQDLLVINDIVVFALHARRLIDSSRYNLANSISIPTKKESLSVRRILGYIIHNTKIEVFRTKFHMKLDDAFIKHGTTDEIIDYMLDDLKKNPYKSSIPPIIILRSDKSEIIEFKLEDLVRTFAEKILTKIVQSCEEYGLYLDASYND